MRMKPKENDIRSARISIRGVVQGVGFRPFVYGLAVTHGLKGWVLNTSGDVRIEVEGPAPQISAFLSGIRTEAPPLSRIEAIEWDYHEPRGFDRFEIRESLYEEGRFQRISPDIATCAACREELFHPSDRRYRYPFINCTHCGPRLTIIRDIPYDRPKTTMAPFTMCVRCREEYDNPVDRRFHAQPNCCPRCGPILEMLDREGRKMDAKDPVFEASAQLRMGKILALKGIGGFLLACDATEEKVIQELRQRKKRPFKPFAVMMTDLEQIRKVCFASAEEEELLASAKSPIVLLRLRRRDLIAPGVAPGLNYLGVMLPYTPLHHLLMTSSRVSLVMTSGNLSEEPIISENSQATQRLSGIADFFLVHNRDIYARCDDSVVLVENRKPQVLRRARGYAPDPVLLPFDTAQVLACGAEIKNTFCMTKDRYAFLSQHIGDMENLETLEHFETMLDLYKKMYRLDPRIVAHDMHPDYLATRYAQGLRKRDPGLTLVPVQHHHAHVVSCMVENRMAPPVLGIAFDGTGYGMDGTVWGGEFLFVERYDRMRRVGHLQTVPLPGGDASVRKPYRMALSYLVSLLGEGVLSSRPVFLEGKNEKEISLVLRQIQKGIHAPMTSSAGRLFDAISALIGVRDMIDYEGQAAIELEMVSEKISDRDEAYPFRVEERNGLWIIRLEDLFRAVLEDLSRGVRPPRISARFHLSVALMIARTAQVISRSIGVDRVALSGGTFQNRLLVGLSRTLLEQEGLKVATHSEIPCNDGGIALGQAVVANFAAGH